MQPALLVRPDMSRPSLYPGEVVSAGSVGRSPCLGFYLSSMRGRDQLLADLLPGVGAEHVFNGILLVPTVSSYRLPHVRPKDDPEIKSGIVLPKSKRRGDDWYVSTSNGVEGFTMNDGSFTGDSSGLPVQIFDNKVTFTCRNRTQVKEEDAAALLDAAQRELAADDVLGVYGLSGNILLTVEIRLAKREYPEPHRTEPQLTAADTKKVKAQRARK